MATPLMTWTVIVATLLALTLIYAMQWMTTRSVGKVKVLSMGSEREELYVPGDMMPDAKAEYDEPDDL